MIHCDLYIPRCVLLSPYYFPIWREEYENELSVSLLIIIDGRDNNHIYARYSVLYIKAVFACTRLFSLD